MKNGRQHTWLSHACDVITNVGNALLGLVGGGFLGLGSELLLSLCGNSVNVSRENESAGGHSRSVKPLRPVSDMMMVIEERSLVG